MKAFIFGICSNFDTFSNDHEFGYITKLRVRKDWKFQKSPLFGDLNINFNFKDILLIKKKLVVPLIVFAFLDSKDMISTHCKRFCGKNGLNLQ